MCIRDRCIYCQECNDDDLEVEHYAVSSRGAWEGRRSSRGQGTSQYSGERRRRRTSLSSGDRSGGEQSPLAMPLPGEGSGHRAPHRLPKQRYRSTEGSREVVRRQGLHQGSGSVPPAIQESMSDESDGDEESGELVRRRVRSSNGRAGVMVRQHYDDPLEFRAGGDQGSRVPGMEELMAIGRGPCLLYTSPSPRDRTRSRMPSSA